MLLPQLRQLDKMNATRLDRASQLARLIVERDLPLKPLAPIPPGESSLSRPAFYKLGFQYTGKGLTRDRLCSALRADGVALDPGFRSLHRTHSKRRFRTECELPVADVADERCVMLHHPILLDDEAAIDRLATGIERVLAHAEDVSNAPDPCSNG